MDVMRYQECADAWIRLRAEYLWSIDRKDRIAFRLTDGSLSTWARWAAGERPRVKLPRTTWVKATHPDASRSSFRAFLHHVMTYAGTLSLSRDLPTQSLAKLAPGDLLVQGGSPGHAVVILDLATHPDGRRLVLLGQSYMPAQEFHVLKNLSGREYSPWFEIADLETKGLATPDWAPFFDTDLRRGDAP